ncbi:MAG: GNAT family N-acetyltransferase [Paracoccaceae bacterium]|uniref:GNAT family N-acetyltransferase n=1 Tax=Seohaeicola saemankumensis TaxID=481181 RepID=UPI001E5DB5AC|nr:GNAT family N-acetyltransferase [Seohaeicola saemankumensis]MCD1625476.1 GNAT family N-acetyltransferase [Seohaeicola saemankumensis]
MILRTAAVRDAPAVAAIWNPVIRDSAATFTTLEKTPESLVADFATRAAEGKVFLLAEDAGEILGFATYFQFRGGPGYARTMEHSVILAPSARGRGVGRTLMRALEEHARAGDVHSLWAGVSAENPGGVAFHNAIGFSEIARLPQVGFKFGRWMDLVLMQKIL